MLLGLILFAGCATRSGKSIDTTNMLANIDPFDIGVATVNMNNFFVADIDNKDLTCLFDPRTNTVLVTFLYQGCKNVWSLSVKERKEIIDAVALYNSDFDGKKLVKSGKTINAYGKTTSFIKWGIISLNSQAEAVLPLGYRFIDSAPYFSITLPVTTNETYASSGGIGARNSPYIVIYCTRAQATVLVGFLSQDYLLKKLDEQHVPANLMHDAQVDINAPDTY